MNNTTEIPNFIVHYSRGEPFQSITGTPNSIRNHAIQSLNETNSWGLNRFKDPDYLQKRISTEAKIKGLFKTLGGEPELDHPIYFFLGRNTRFELHPLNRAYQINLSQIPASLVSFTYGDSLLSFDENYRRQSDERYQNPLCEKLFQVHTLEHLFSDAQYPKEAPLHVEAQIWAYPKKFLEPY